ncbi:MAG: hypothetical protein GY858_03805, partial [Candidatus Omnitrophica bacterium]|nr:hypothetical protein [Candidatus Omnitrophota bacterium]
LFIWIIFLNLNIAYADCRGTANPTCTGRTETNCTSPCEWFDDEGSGDRAVSLDNPLSGTTDINVLIGKVINAVLGVVGSLALVMFIFGGFTWMLAGGNKEKVTKGKDIIIWAAIGLIIIFSAYALVKIIFTGLGGA